MYSVKLHVIVEFDDLVDLHKSELPDVEDARGVMDALLRLQDTYEIPAHQFVDGTFTSQVNSPRMTGKLLRDYQFFRLF